MPLQVAKALVVTVKSLMINATSLESVVRPNGDICVWIHFSQIAKPLVVCLEKEFVVKYKRHSMTEQDLAKERLFAYLSDKYDKFKTAPHDDGENCDESSMLWKITVTDIFGEENAPSEIAKRERRQLPRRDGKSATPEP